MFKKINTKILLIILAVLIGIYIVSNFYDSTDRSFRSELVSIDTSMVNKIIIKQPGVEELTLYKSGKQWRVANDINDYATESRNIKGMLSGLINSKITRVAGTNENRWKLYQVTDSLGTRVKFADDDDVLADIFFGKVREARSGRFFSQRRSR